MADTLTGRSRVSEEIASVSDEHGILFMSAARVLLASSHTFLALNSDALFLDMCGGDQARARRLLNRSELVETLLSFILQPVAGSLADMYGRRLFVLEAPLLLAALRYCVSMRGSRILTFLCYQQISNLAMMPFGIAMNCMSSDLLGRGSDASVVMSRRIEVLASVTQMILIRLLRYVPSPRYGFRLSASFSLVSFLLLLLGTRETLPLAKRKPVQWDMRALVCSLSPFSFMEVFGQSSAMKAIALLTIVSMQSGGNLNNGSLLLFRKHKHDWGQVQQSNLMLIAQICGLGQAFVQGPILRALGLKAAFKWGERLGALEDLNTALSPTSSTFCLNPFFRTSRQSPEVLSRILDTEARLLGISEGRLAAASENLTFLFRLLMPSFFTEIYVRTLDWFPGGNFLVSAAFQLLNAEVLGPLVWDRFSSEMLNQVSIA